MSHWDRSVQDGFLNGLRRERIPVSLYLMNGIRLTGVVQSFDPFLVEIKGNETHVVYKHAISSILPGRAVGAKPTKTNGGSERPVAVAPTAASSKGPVISMRRSKLRGNSE